MIPAKNVGAGGQNDMNRTGTNPVEVIAASEKEVPCRTATTTN